MFERESLSLSDKLRAIAGRDLCHWATRPRQTGALPDRPTDRPTLLLLIPLSIFLPRPFRIFISPLFSRYALRYEPNFDFRGWYFRFYSRHSVRVGEREEGEFPSPTFFIPNPKEYPQAKSSRKFTITLKIHNAL